MFYSLSTTSDNSRINYYINKIKLINEYKINAKKKKNDCNKIQMSAIK